MKLMSHEEKRFLSNMRDGKTLAIADRREDRARQWCRRNGLAEVLKNPRRWAITETGRKILETTL